MNINNIKINITNLKKYNIDNNNNINNIITSNNNRKIITLTKNFNI